MSTKNLERICIECINHNKNLQIGRNFKVSVEFGECDLCGKKHIIIPYGRFFDAKTTLQPSPSFEEKVGRLINSKKQPEKEAPAKNAATQEKAVAENKGNKNQKKEEPKIEEPKKEDEKVIDVVENKDDTIYE